MSRLWSTNTAAPHRVMFLPGALQGVAAMLWWMLDLESRLAGGAGFAPGDLPASALHMWSLLYGFFPFFVFGFLFTAAPNWLNGPAIPRRAYLASGLAMAAGVLLTYLAVLDADLLLPGLALHVVGWGVALLALARTLALAPPQDKRHAGIATLAVALGGLGNLAFLLGVGMQRPSLVALATLLAIWAFLVPVFLTVCHRMIPWFSSRIVANYVMIRPYGPLWAALAAGLARGALELAGRPELAWPADLAMAAIVFWFAMRWGFARGVRQVRLLAMLHIAFLWAGAAFALHGLDSLAAFAGVAWSAGHAPAHALGIGFFATMLIAMASRVSLGHSGRALQADGLTWSLFWLIQLAAVTRMLPDLAALFPARLVSLGGLLWLLAFGLWAWKYAPMYWRARIDGKMG